MTSSEPRDLSMMDLFRSEVESQAAVLTEGLLSLENDPGATKNLESLMRAAHSIKGGARIVDLDDAVRLAHALEDCFESIREKGIRLAPHHIDILLSGVDMITRISEIQSPDEADAGMDAVAHLVGQIREISETPEKPPPEKPAPQDGKPVSPADPPETTGEALPVRNDVPVAAPPPPLLPSPETAIPAERSAGKDRTVRVLAAKIERLMAFSGEVAVSAQWFPGFFQHLIRLKHTHAELLKTLDALHRLLSRKEDSEKLLRLVGKARETAKDCNFQLADRLHQLDRFASAAETLSDKLYREAIGIRMCPFSECTRGYPRMVRDLARDLGKKISLEIVGETVEMDRDMLDKLEAPLAHLIRNAIDHGIEPPQVRVSLSKSEAGRLRIEACHRAGMLMITVADDGCGVDSEHLRQQVVARGRARPDAAAVMSDQELMAFLFLEGFTTKDRVTEISGRGYGLNVVYKAVHEVGGVVRVESSTGRGMRFTLELPLTRSVIRTFLVRVGDEPYAFPLARIDRCLRVEAGDIRNVEDRQYFRYDDINISLVDIRSVLEIPGSETLQDPLNVVVISEPGHAYGLVVDEFLGECELVVRPIFSRVAKIPDVSAAAVMMDGTPVLILDVEDLIHSIGGMLEGRSRLNRIGIGRENEAAKPPKRILVVDDSFIVREKERKILENKGYQVETAVDGMDGWNLLRIASYDMVVTDIDMPRMNGIELIQHIKTHDQLKSLPVIIVSYKTNEEDRLQGLAAGADYYLHKTDFDDNSLINAVADLIGEATETQEIS